MGMRPVELSLGHISEKLNEQRITTEIAESLSNFENKEIHKSLPALTASLERVSKNSKVVLFIDELPIEGADDPNNTNDMQIVRYFSSLIESIRAKCGSEIVLIFSSINKPNNSSITQKFKEQSRFIEVEAWAKNELSSLAKLITEALPAVTLPKDIESKVIDACKGNPRMLKSFFKRRLIANIETEDFDQSLALVVQEHS
jgi:hypothetical protein